MSDKKPSSSSRERSSSERRDKKSPRDHGTKGDKDASGSNISTRERKSNGERERGDRESSSREDRKRSERGGESSGSGSGGSGSGRDKDRSERRSKNDRPSSSSGSEKKERGGDRDRGDRDRDRGDREKRDKGDDSRKHREDKERSRDDKDEKENKSSSGRRESARAKSEDKADKERRHDKKESEEDADVESKPRSASSTPRDSAAAKPTEADGKDHGETEERVRPARKKTAPATEGADRSAGTAQAEVNTGLTREAIFAHQKESLLLLLEARVLFDKMVKLRWAKEQKEIEEQRKREKQERVTRDGLRIPEIQSVLKSQPDSDEGDWISDIQELKRKLVVEIRRNHKLDSDLQKLDKRIGLLIKNRTLLESELKGMEKKKKGHREEDDGQPLFDLKKDPRKLEFYQEMFYLLQTEPRYLAKCVYLIQPEEMDSFLETTILTLYGDAFSPREEFLILRLFQLAIKNEIAKISSLADFLKANTVVPKMVITYNKRKQGLEYLKTVLGPLLKGVIERKALNLELNPIVIYQAMINEEEVKTGEKSTLDRNPTEEAATAHPVVTAARKQRLAALRDICQMFLDGIINSMSSLPYGIRWICKQIKQLSMERFGKTLDNDQVLKVTGYFVYYRFINLAIVTPDATKVVDHALDPDVRKNLVVVGKVLQNLFNFRLFSKQEKFMAPLNSFIEKNMPTVEHYFDSLVKVDDPEDYLQVNKYMELTQKTKPVILISLHEISMTHRMLLQNLEALATEKEDPLKLILNDLGDPPPMIGKDDREIQLTLANRFKVDVEEEDEVERMYTETKELIIPVLRTIPIESSIHRLHLTDVLESGIRFASENGNKSLSTAINKILENIAKLEKLGRLSKSDRYESFVRDISTEVANRRIIREQQKKEIDRLKATLESLQKHQHYINEQINQYQEYLGEIRKNMLQGPGSKGKKKQTTSVGPFKFSYKDLEKQGVIVDSAVPEMSRKRTQFIITSQTVGVFDITAKIAGINVEKMQLELDDLLERHYNGVECLDLEQVTLDINMTIHLLNKYFLLKK